MNNSEVSGGASQPGASEEVFRYPPSPSCSREKGSDGRDPFTSSFLSEDLNGCGKANSRTCCENTGRLWQPAIKPRAHRLSPKQLRATGSLALGALWAFNVAEGPGSFN
ncbi:hypothetical protein SRHO_G00303830 [Serrasalmus rhombeus]